MMYRVAQIRKPFGLDFNITESTFIIIDPPVKSITEARNMVESLVELGANEEWFIIIKSYPTRNQIFPD